MNGRDVVRRLKAFKAGRPIPRGSTLHLEIADDEDLLMLAFVRMGGESLPWAVGIGQPGREPRIWSVPDGRRREPVVEMLTELTPILGAHLDSPQWSDSEWNAFSEADEMPLKQIWVPNGSHVQMLHMLNLRYTFARAGDPERAAILRSLGRLSGYLFREAGRLGQATIVDSTSALQEAFTFPVDDLRQQHLGLLLAWLQAKGGKAKRTAAAEAAERQSISISLDPDLERDSLEPMVDRFTKARREDRPRVRGKVEREIAAILEDEVRRRLDCVAAAISLLSRDPRPLNEGAEKLAIESTKARQWDYLFLEQKLATDGEEAAFPPSPETDRDRRTGAARYHRQSSAEEEMSAALIHHDEELQEDAVSDGVAIAGSITRVEDRAPEDARGKVPVWTVETTSAAPTKMRKGSSVCVAGMPSRTGRVIDVHQSNGTRSFEIEIDGWKNRPDADRHPKFAHVPAATDAALEGEEITLLGSSGGGFGIRKGKRVRDDSGPGAWLTHGAGVPPRRKRKRSGERSLVDEVEKLRST